MYKYQNIFVPFASYFDHVYKGDFRGLDVSVLYGYSNINMNKFYTPSYL